jgi:hypothetical protein
MNGDAGRRSIMISINRSMTDLMKNAILPVSARFWRYKILHQALMTKTTEGISQRGLYEIHAQTKNPRNN